MKDEMPHWAHELYGDEVVTHELECLKLTFLKREFSDSFIPHELGLSSVILYSHEGSLMISLTELSDAISPLNASTADQIDFLATADHQSGHRILQALLPDLPILFYEVDESDAAAVLDALKELEDTEEFAEDDGFDELEDIEDLEEFDELDDINMVTYCGLVFFEGYSVFVGLCGDPEALENFALPADVGNLIQLTHKLLIIPVPEA